MHEYICAWVPPSKAHVHIQTYRKKGKKERKKERKEERKRAELNLWVG